jgi:hypothetical protein
VDNFQEHHAASRRLGTVSPTDLAEEAFFLGTMQQFHGFSPNPWVIIGVLPMPYPPPMEQIEFFDS